MFFSFILLLFFVVAYPQQFLVEGTKPTRPGKFTFIFTTETIGACRRGHFHLGI